jgi:hypothetical protein
MNRRLASVLIIILCSGCVLGCSGSSDQVGTTGFTNPFNTTNTGCVDRNVSVGIEGGGLRRITGVIVSIGSDDVLTVGCERFSIDGAQIIVNGSPGSKSDLRVNYVVTVVASTDPESGIAHATAVYFDGAVAGDAVPAVLSGTLKSYRRGIFGTLVEVVWDGPFGAVTVDGNPASASDLRFGDVITLRGTQTFSPLGVEQRADATDVLHVIDGNVESVDLGHNRIQVMGQSVVIAPLPLRPIAGTLELTTDARELATLLRALKIGDRIAISGYGSPSGEILATGVESRAAARPFMVNGIIGNIDTAQFRFALNALIIDYSRAQLLGFPGGQPSPGDRMAAFADAAPAGGILSVSRLVYVPGELEGPAGADVSIEGVITRVDSATDFDINGHPVRLRKPAACLYQTPVEFELRTGIWAFLTGGSLRADGAVTDSASGADVCATQSYDVRLVGPIEAISPRTLSVAGFEINHSPLVTEWGTDPSQLQIGDIVSVYGAPGLADQSLVASTIVPAQSIDASDARLGTIMFSLAEPAIDVAGRPILTTPSTVFLEWGASGTRSATWFFSKSWYVRCFKTSQDLVTLDLKLDQDADGEWIATEVMVRRHSCPD